MGWDVNAHEIDPAAGIMQWGVTHLHNNGGPGCWFDLRGDFTKVDQSDYPLCSVVVGNPAFHIAGEILDKALAIAPVVVLLLPMKWLASKGRLKRWTSEDGPKWPLAHVDQIVPRISFKRKVFVEVEDPETGEKSSEWTGGWTEKGSDSQEYGVFVFNRHHRGPWTGGHLEWR